MTKLLSDCLNVCVDECAVIYIVTPCANPHIAKDLEHKIYPADGVCIVS